MMKKISQLLSAVVVAGLSVGQRRAGTTTGIPAVTGFEAERYLGRWYEIARLPHFFERDMDFVTAEYSRRKDGRIRVLNAGERDGRRKTAEGIAVPAGASTVGELRVSFFRPFYGGYRIIYLEPDYSAAIVAGSTKTYLWLLARSPELPAEQLQRYSERIAGWGFEVDRLEYPQQSSDRALA
ncbi:lipocalin family protein [Victivallis sp. Marseille-Q1083]|uniref:lipocalin family protein n=1 Tax=Victivallis sp. Marseille-Q1083 TaxID=2717288 RepID=UPI001C375A3F|nr:lipocalin family protein [Victivallis sp. Marseille-Q1083]